ncbi:hypothetical protein SARC_15098, partial [Sphaeroforma arctica JP610]
LLVYINESVAGLIGVYPFSEHLTTNVLTYTQRSMILNTTKAERDLGYQPSRSVYESISMIMETRQRNAKRSRPNETAQTALDTTPRGA